MTFKPLTYKEYRSGIPEGTTITVDDNTVNTDVTLPLIGKDYVNYGPILAQQHMYMLENFNTSTPQNLGDSMLAGTLIYNNSLKVLVGQTEDIFNPIVLNPNTVDVSDSSIIPEFDVSFDFGLSTNTWENIYVDNISTNIIYITDPVTGNFKTLEESFIVTSDEVIHVGSNLQNQTVTEVLDHVNDNSEFSNSVTRLDDSVTEIMAINNASYVFIGALDADVPLVETDTDDLISFTVVSSTQNFTMNVPVGSSDNFNFDMALTTLTINGGAYITKFNQGTHNTWLVTGDIV